MPIDLGLNLTYHTYLEAKEKSDQEFHAWLSALMEKEERRTRLV